MSEEDLPNDPDHSSSDDGAAEAAEFELGSWVLDLRNRFAERASVALPAGVEPSVVELTDLDEESVLPRVVFLVGVCVIDQELRVALSVDLMSEDEVLEASLPIREALGEEEDGLDPAAEWFAPLEGWVDVDPTEGAESTEEDGEGPSQSSGPADPVWGAAVALVRDVFTEDAHLALQVGELDDQLIVGRRCVGAVVALPRGVVEPLVENETVMLVTLPQILDPDLLEETEVEVDGFPENLHVAYIDDRRIASSSYQVLLGLADRLRVGEEDEDAS